MRIQLLGCHHTETATTRLSTLLVDQELALDAGAITSTLTSEEQRRIRAVLITHHHYDHVRDLLSLALGGYEDGMTISVFSSAETLDKLRRHFLDGSLYPDFTQIPTLESPRLRLIALEAWREHEICGLKATPIPMPHTVPAVGYHITALSGRGFFYTGDTGGGLYDVWGRMAIVDTKPFKLRVILHRIFVERPQVTGIPAWPGGAACYRRSRYIL